MNILILNEHFNLGGLERVSTVIGKSLEQNFNVFYYGFSSDENFYDIKTNFVFNPYNKTRKSKWLRWNSYLKKIETTLTKQFNPERYLKKDLIYLANWINDNKIDIVIISSPLLISCISFLEQNVDCKFIAWIHNNYTTYIENYTKNYHDAFINSIAKADKVVCLTLPDEVMFKKLNPDTVCIYNPLTIRHNLLSNLNSKNIAFTGRLSFQHKGIDYLVEIAKKLPDGWSISLAGSGSKAEIKELEFLIKQNGLENKLIFRGPLKDKDLLDHYLNSSLYIMTSRWEGMPLVLAEAMSFGLPIFAFKQTGSNEVLKNGEYGILFENGDIDAISNKIREVSLDKDKLILKKYQALSLDRLEAFNLENITKQWISIINESVGINNESSNR